MQLIVFKYLTGYGLLVSCLKTTSGNFKKMDLIRLSTWPCQLLHMPSKGKANWSPIFHLNYFHIPVEWELPEVSQFNCCVDLLQAQHLRGQKVWLHCALNQRVSVFIYLYRKLILHEAEEKAAYPMREIWTPDQTWQNFIGEVIEEYQK